MSDSTSDARERPIAPVEVPSCLALWTDGCRWSENLVGEAGAAVYRLARTGDAAADGTGFVQRALYLKHGRGPAAEDVFDEAARLRWLSAHLPVPTVRLVISSPAGDRVAIRAGDASDTQAADRRLVRTDTQQSREDDVMSAVDETWLLMDALPGQTAHEILASSVDAPATQAQVVDALVAFLQRLHAIPVESCPFINDHHRRLIRARAHLDAGRVDEDDFGAIHDGWSAQQVWNAMVALLPIDVDPVVTHGDFSLDNVIVTKNEATGDYQVVGCLDVGRAGVADQYQDLAILHDCLGEFGSELQGRVFTQFGIAKVDDAKLRFHLALDEFF